MPQPPLTFLEKRWATGYGSNNSLIRSATQTNDRKNVPSLDYDVYRNISTYGRRTLLSLGRYLFENCSPLRGMVKEMARLAASTFTPQFAGKNAEWGQLAEALLAEEDKFIDVRGFPYSMDAFRRLLVISLIRDGEFGVILTTVNDEPRFQCIPSHRIGSRSFNTEIAQGGRWDGAKVIDGCVVGDYGETLAYRVYNESGTTFQDISTNDMLLVFIPDYVEQLRGISPLGTHAFDAWDIQEGRQFELIAQKLRATMPVSIKNETGMVDTTKAVFGAKATANDSSTNAANSLPTQVVQPGSVMYFRAGKGEGIEFNESDNPGPNVMAFQEEVLRSMFHGLGWSFDFSHNPSKVGGAQMRVVVDKINASIAEIQKLGLEPTCRRTTGWRVSKHIGKGRLPEDSEWYKWNFARPAEITADEKYTSDVIIQEMHAGLRSPQNAIERLGGYWENTQDESIDFEKRFQEKCKAAGVDRDRIIWPGPNGFQQQPEPQKPVPVTDE